MGQAKTREPDDDLKADRVTRYEDHEAFLAALDERTTPLDADVSAVRCRRCRRGQSFHPRLRVKRAQGHPGVWEMTWAPDGRATFQYGHEVRPGEPHIVWRRVGPHAIFRRP